MLWLLTCFAVVLMHSAFGAHCAGAAMPTAHDAGHEVGHAAHEVGPGHHADMGVPTIAGAVDKASPNTDCMMSASCTFVLRGAAGIVVLAILVLLVYPARDLFVRLVIPRRVILGRPPPWAIATHLRLGVILR